MDNSNEALRIELEDLKNNVYQLNEDNKTLVKHVNLQVKRIDRIVEVLLDSLPQKVLNKRVTFSGTDCHGSYRTWLRSDKRTLKDFLTYIIDP